MAYAPPAITAAGLSIPTYTDIQADLIAQFLNIYGQNAYLGPDSADYQWISIVALRISDTLQAAQLAYNARSPLTAIGSDLDGVIKCNGMTRLAASSSTCNVTLTGTPGANITTGICKDVNGYLWDLPALVTIGAGGTVTVLATCETIGAVNAAAGQISIIATPAAGWTSVTNSSPAVAGQPVETDARLRARQSISVALPSQTMLAGTTAAIAATSGVTRYAVYENYLGYTASYGACNTSGTAVTITQGYALDSSDIGQSITINGTAYTISTIGSSTTATLSTSAGTLTGASFYIGNGTELGPAHSITCVVEGGTDTNVAQAIYNNRGIGCDTNGASSVTITDPFTGSSMPIGFSRPSYVPIYVSLSVHPLTGYTSAVQPNIQAGIVNYLNTLQIGETVVLSELYGAALTARPNPAQPEFSIRALTLGTSASPTGTSDVAIQWNQVAQGVTANVVITLV
jgi:uncharacterized phage protein gp47/JayE